MRHKQRTLHRIAGNDVPARVILIHDFPEPGKFRRRLRAADRARSRYLADQLLETRGQVIILLTVFPETP
jgi:hypothetical protein